MLLYVPLPTQQKKEHKRLDITPTCVCSVHAVHRPADGVVRAGAMRVCSLLHTPRADVGTINSALLRYALFTNDEIAHRVHFDVNRHVETLSQSQIKRYIFSPLLKNQNSKADSPAKTPAEKSLISYPVTKVAKVLHFSLAVSGASHHTTDIHAATTAATITTTSKCCSRIQVTR